MPTLPNPTLRRWRAAALTMLGTLIALPTLAALGLAEVKPLGDDGPVTVFYATDAPEQPLVLGSGVITLQVARDAPPRPGNGRLVVISHGSGGSPWVHADLARALADAGYLVAVPRHHADNYRDTSEPGPESWDRRPAEVGRTIDALAADARFAARFASDRVGLYGMSAGGHAALAMAGGQWSPARFAQHCQANVAADFQACVGLFTSLKGDWADGLKLWAARTVLGLRFQDATPRRQTDARIAAVVAAVPYAADFDMASFATLHAPLALVTAAGDTWLHPQFHSSRVLAACPRCEHLADLPGASHGAYLAPLPRGFEGLLANLLNDPPGFSRAGLREVDQRVVRFFDRHLAQP